MTLIEISELLKILSSTNNKKYNKSNVKFIMKNIGTYQSGRTKFNATILSGTQEIFSGDAMEIEQKNGTKKILVNDESLYKVDIVYE